MRCGVLPGCGGNSQSLCLMWQRAAAAILVMILLASHAWTEPVTAAEPPAETSRRTAAGATEARPKQSRGAEAGTPEDEDRYEFRKDHDPNGIGKFYLGREIAHVMGYQAAGWLERPQREKEEGLSLLIEALKLKPGMTVADVGAGSGVLSVMMARKVGPEGRVLAVDIQEEMLSLLRNKSRQLGLKNIVPVLGTPRSPKLPAGSVDVALMVDVYHEFSFPWEMMQSLSRAMKPGGRVVLVEYRKEDPKVRRQIKLVHTMTQKQVRAELEQAAFGLKWTETIGVLPLQHIIVFEKQAERAAEDTTSGGAGEAN